MVTRVLGIKHGMAKQPFEVVQKARELRQRNGWSVRRISEYLGVKYHTVEDWIYFRTRVAA